MIPASWADYSGTWFGICEGLAIFDSPANLWHPSLWLTRDYGFFSPTPMNWIGDKGFDLAQGRDLSLVYRVIVHAGSAEDAGIAGLYTLWAQ